MKTSSSSVEYAVTYASAWMRVPLPIVVSFSTSAPRPTTTLSRDLDALADARLVADDAGGADPRAGEDDRAGRDRPCRRRSRPAAAARASRSTSRRASAACRRPRSRARARPRRAPCPGRRRGRGSASAPATLSYLAAPSSDVACSAVERADDARAVLGHLAPVALAADQPEELLAFEPQRLGGVDLRDVDVAGARLPLAVGLGPLPRRLLVHGHLPLELHVVEDDHLLAADDGHLPHLVRVEPREVHVRDLPAREAQVAEDDVLDALGRKSRPCATALVGLLVEQVEDHREVVHAERPERVLVRADDAEVLAVAVHAEHLAELARVDELLQLPHARVVEQEVARHEHEVAVGRDRDELVDLLGPHRGRLLDEHVLPRLERLLRKCVVRRYRRRDDDAFDLGSRRGAPRTTSRDARRGSARRTSAVAPGRGRRATRARRARRSCERGSGPSSRGRTTPITA